MEIPPSTNVAENTHQYTGQERDETTGMDYMHFRYYGSNLGRFMKPDNIQGNLMNPQDWNRYSYCHGNPVNFNDPTGHQAQHDKEGPDNTSDSTAATPPPQQKELGKGRQEIGSFEGSQEQAQKKANELTHRYGIQVHGSSSDGKHWTFSVKTGDLCNIRSHGGAKVLSKLTKSGERMTPGKGAYFHKGAYWANVGANFPKMLGTHALSFLTGAVAGAKAGWKMGGEAGFIPGMITGALLGTEMNAIAWVGRLRKESTFQDGHLPSESPTMKEIDNVGPADEIIAPQP